MRSDCLEHLAINDKGFAFDASTGHTYTLNETGIFALKLIMAGKRAGEIAEAMAREYEVPAERAERDLNDFRQSLLEMRILKNDSPEASHEG